MTTTNYDICIFTKVGISSTHHKTFDLEDIMWETIAGSVVKILIQKAPDLVEKLKKTNSKKSIGAEYGYLLTGRLIFLLRYLEHTGDVRYPKRYGRILMTYVEAGTISPPANYAPQAEDAWQHASQYACWYLSALGLVSQFGAVGGEVGISEQGQEILKDSEIRRKFKSAFEQQIPS
jgi:hypothetical protein